MNQGMLSAEARECLRSSRLFGVLANHELEEVMALCREEAYEAGTAVTIQGERSHSLYLIIEGAIALERTVQLGGEGAEAKVTIDILSKGTTFGWSALLEPHAHTATAMCLEQTRVIAIDGADLSYFLEKHPAAGYEVMRELAAVLASRLRAAYAALEKKL